MTANLPKPDCNFQIAYVFAIVPYKSCNHVYCIWKYFWFELFLVKHQADACDMQFEKHCTTTLTTICMFYDFLKKPT